MGSIAITLLAVLGYRAAASTGKPDALRRLGVVEIPDRALFSAESHPMASERWVSALDAVGDRTLANVLAQTKYGGTVTACGFVGGVKLPP